MINNGEYDVWSGHSTELVLELVDWEKVEMDNNRTSINIFIELSKTFDTFKL